MRRYGGAKGRQRKEGSGRAPFRVNVPFPADHPRSPRDHHQGPSRTIKDHQGCQRGMLRPQGCQRGILRPPPTLTRALRILGAQGRFSHIQRVRGYTTFRSFARQRLTVSNYVLSQVRLGTLSAYDLPACLHSVFLWVFRRFRRDQRREARWRS